MADDTLVALWQETFQKYRESTQGKHDLRYDKNLQNLKTLDDVNRQIESAGDDFKDFRKKNQKLWANLARLAQPLVALSSVTSSAVALTPYAPASLIFGAGMYLIKSGQGVSGAYDEIAGVFAKISLAFERFDEYRKSDVDPKLKTRISEIFCKTIEIMGHAQSLVRKGRGRTFIAKVFGGDPDIFALRADLDTLVDAEARLVGVLTYRGVKNLEVGVDTLTDTTKMVAKNVSDLSRRSREKDELEELDKILRAPLFTKVQVRHRQLRDECIDKTGQWLLDNKDYDNWAVGRTTVLSLLGEGGVGKSHLAVRIIQDLERRIRSGDAEYQNLSMAYYYIERNDKDLTSTNNLLKVVAYQLAQRFMDYLEFTLNNASELETARWQDTWNSLYKPYFEADSRSDQLAIVVDAVDEMSPAEREELFEIIHNIDVMSRAQDPPRVRIILTGRIELLSQVQRYGRILEISRFKMKEDVKLYITDHVKHLSIVKEIKDRKKKIGFMRSLRDQIMEHDFVFLWVQLIMSTIKEVDRPSEVRDILERPAQVFEVIDAIVERLMAENMRPRAYQDLNRILGWVWRARRDLTLGEIGFVLQFTDHGREGIPLHRLESLLRGRYSAFFVVTRDDGETTESLQEKALKSAEEERKAASGIHSPRSNDFDDDDIDIDIDEDLDDDEVEAYDLNQAVEHDKSTSGPFSTKPGKMMNEAVGDPTERTESSSKSDPWLSDPDTTYVSLRHGLIGDYLDQRGHITGGIGVDKTYSELEIVQVCLDLFLKEKAEGDTGEYLIKYAAAGWGWHLGHLDYYRLDGVPIGGLICQMTDLLTNPRALRSWIQNYKNLGEFRTEIFGPLGREIYRWLSHDLSTVSYDPSWTDTVGWLAEDSRNVVNGLARTVAEEWLVSDEPVIVPVDCANFLETYRLFIMYKWQRPTRLDHRIRKVDVTKLSVERIRDLARMWYGDQRHYSRWHGRLGRVLHAADHQSSALEEYRLAVEMNATNLEAIEGMVKLYTDREDDEKAAEICQLVVADEGLVKNDTTRHTWLSYLAASYGKLCDFDEAIRIRSKLFWQKKDADNFYKLMGIMEDAERMQDQSLLLIELWKLAGESPGDRLLTQLITDGNMVTHFHVYRCLLHCSYTDRSFPSWDHEDKGQPPPSDWVEFGIRIYTDVTAMQKRNGVTNSIDGIIRLLLGSEIVPVETSIETLESLLDQRMSQDRDAVYIMDEFILHVGLLGLANMHIYLALDYARNFNTAGVEISRRKIQGLIEKFEKRDSAIKFRKVLSMVHLLLGRANMFSDILGVIELYLGNKAVANQYFQETMTLVLDMLSDDTTKNDASGFRILGGLLLAYGDIENGLIAYAVSLISYERRRKMYGDAMKRLEKQKTDGDHKVNPTLRSVLELSQDPSLSEDIEVPLHGQTWPYQLDHYYMPQARETRQEIEPQKYALDMGFTDGQPTPYANHPIDHNMSQLSVADDRTHHMFPPSPTTFPTTIDDQPMATTVSSLSEPQTDSKAEIPQLTDTANTVPNGQIDQDANPAEEQTQAMVEKEPNQSSKLDNAYRPIKSRSRSTSTASYQSSTQDSVEDLIVHYKEVKLGEENPSYLCAIECGNRAEEVESFYTCRYCISAFYCGSCMSKYRPDPENVRDKDTSVDAYYSNILKVDEDGARVQREWTPGEKLFLNGPGPCLSWHPTVQIWPPSSKDLAFEAVEWAPSLHDKGKKVLLPRKDFIDKLKKEWKVGAVEEDK